MEIKKYNLDFSVCKVSDFREVNPEEEFVFLAGTDDEKSLVCRTESVPANVVEKEDGWKMMRIQGVLDFSLVGILAKIASLLADHKISIFAVSTYNTDYLFVKEPSYENALRLLSENGYDVVD